MLGIYMLGYGISMLIIQGIRKAFHANIYTTILMLVLGLVIADSIIYLIYAMSDVTDLSFSAYMWTRLLPTILANLIFLLLAYPFVYNRLLKWKHDLQEGT